MSTTLDESLGDASSYQDTSQPNLTHDLSDASFDASTTTGTPAMPLPRIMDREQLLQQWKELEAENERLTSVNAILQQKLVTHFNSKKTDQMDAAEQDKLGMDEAEGQKKYQELMYQLQELQTQYSMVKQKYDAAALEKQAILKEKEAKAAEVRETFVQFKRELAFNPAENSRTGKPIPQSTIIAYEQQELRKDQEVERVRLKHISLKNQLRKLESQLQKKEELKDGLHLIDFEQLKIENQTFNEKIEERNEELLKLRKKIHTTVLMLTHVKEKLQFVQEENRKLKDDLTTLEIAVVNQRDALTRTKQDRDQLRSENIKLRQQSALIGADDLLRDFDDRETAIETAEADLEKAKQRFQTLTQRIKDSTQQLMQSQSMSAASSQKHLLTR